MTVVLSIQAEPKVHSAPSHGWEGSGGLRLGVAADTTVVAAAYPTRPNDNPPGGRRQLRRHPFQGVEDEREAEVELAVEAVFGSQRLFSHLDEMRVLVRSDLLEHGACRLGHLR